MLSLSHEIRVKDFLSVNTRNERKRGRKKEAENQLVLI